MTHIESRRLITQYVGEGLTRKEIAWRMCRTHEHICNMLRRMGIALPRSNRVDCPELDRMILDGKTNMEIGRVMDVERSFLKRRRMALGKPVKTWKRRAG